MKQQKAGYLAGAKRKLHQRGRTCSSRGVGIDAWSLSIRGSFDDSKRYALLGQLPVALVMFAKLEPADRLLDPQGARK